MERGIYELWYKTAKKYKKLGSFNNLERLQNAWSKALKEYHFHLLEARIRMGPVYKVANDLMPLAATSGHLDFKTSQERDDYIITNAKYFTIVRFLGVGKYERHEKPTLEEAEELALALSGDKKGNYLIYAVGPLNLSAFVKSVIFKKGRNNA